MNFLVNTPKTCSPFSLLVEILTLLTDTDTRNNNLKVRRLWDPSTWQGIMLQATFTVLHVNKTSSNKSSENNL